MANVQVKLDKLDATWTQACKQAVTDLNTLFKHKGVAVTLSLAAGGPVITVKTDSKIGATAVHGEATTEQTGTGRLLRSEIRFPATMKINTPSGLRPAGPGIYLVVAAHEFVHSLGHGSHNTHLMAQTLQKVMGDSPKGDKLQAGAVMMPPLQLSDASVQELKAIWG